MGETFYNKIVAFKADGSWPLAFPSTKSNFIALCAKFDMNSASHLTRNGKLVLKKEDLERNLKIIIS